MTPPCPSRLVSRGVRGGCKPSPLAPDLCPCPHVPSLPLWELQWRERSLAKWPALVLGPVLHPPQVMLRLPRAVLEPAGPAPALGPVLPLFVLLGRLPPPRGCSPPWSFHPKSPCRRERRPCPSRPLHPAPFPWPRSPRGPAAPVWGPSTRTGWPCWALPGTQWGSLPLRETRQSPRAHSSQEADEAQIRAGLTSRQKCSPLPPGPRASP